MSDLSKFIKRSRARAGITLRELAEKTGLSASYLCDAENDRRTFSPSALRAFCEATGTNYAQAVRHVLKDVERRYLEKYTEVE